MKKLTLAALLLVVPTAAAIAGSEVIPPVTDLSDEARARIERYRSLSKITLESGLTPLVEETALGRDFLGQEWDEVCEDAISDLIALREEQVVPPSLSKWYENELAAWTNVRRIGHEMIEQHYRIASTLELVELDAKDSEAFFKAWQGRLKGVNDAAGRANDFMKVINKASDDYARVADIVGPLAESLGVLHSNAKTISRLLATFRTKKTDFIDEMDLRGAYRTKLDKLKSKSIDPDQTGVFHSYEKEWEETMYDSYQRYIVALDKWRKINAWYQKEQVLNLFKTVAYKAVKLGGGELLGIKVPGVLEADPEKLGEWCLALKEVKSRAFEKIKGEEWARIERELDSLDDERGFARTAFEKRIRELVLELGEHVATAQEEHEKATESLKKELQEVGRELERAADDRELERRCLDRMDRLSKKMDEADRSLEKSERYFRNDWYKAEENAAHKQMREKLSEIKRRDEELNRRKPK